jgi:beta-xylosidase
MPPHWKWRSLLLLFCGLGLLILATINPRLTDQPSSALAYTSDSGCDQLGWSPENYQLKDHSVFKFDGYYYIVSIRLPDEKGFAYGRSTDLCNWEDLGTIIDARTSGEWDESVVWAPFVWEDQGIFYMYYTGVNHKYTQSIMLAVSDNPADPGSWQRLGMIFQPDHKGTLWKAGKWADCRDATVMKDGDFYYMVYTGLDAAGPIIGLAASISPVGPWNDWGATLALPQTNAMAESPLVISHAGNYYLVYNKTYHGEEYRIGPDLIGPWSEAYPLAPGWANEFWFGQDGRDYTSYLQGYDIVIDRIHWDDSSHPPRLLMSAGTYRLLFPMMLNP